MCSASNGKVAVETINKGPRFGVRHVQALLLYFLIGVSTALRSSMTVAILSMTEKPELSNHTTYEWNKVIIGFIMGSPAWGDIAVQPFAGAIANKYGSKIVLTVTVGFTAVLMMLTPQFASVAGWIGVCICAGLQGAFQGFICPCVHTLIGKWSPVNERTRYAMFVYSGMYMALIITPPISAFICTSSYGWPWSYYIFGSQSFLGGILWYFFGATSPAQHSTITEEEKIYIEMHLDKESKRGLKTPWRSIITSVPFIALIITQAGCIWAFNIIYTETPTYFKLALGKDLEESGLLTSLAYMLAFTFSIVTSFIADWLLNREIMSLTSIRKLCNTLGSWCPALCMMIVTYIPIEYSYVSVGFFVLLVGLDAINSCGFMINHIDLAPNFAGVLVGISSFFSGITCIVAPIMTGVFVKDMTDVTQWRKVYILAASMYFIGDIVYMIFGSANTQKWNNPEESEDIDEEEASKDLMNKKATNG